MEQLSTHACREYLEGLQVLGMRAERMPVIEQINQTLRTRTNWLLLPVSGFLPGRTFFDLLASRIFPVTTYIRKPDSLDYTPEPDIFHDIFGHVPMHAHKVFADYLQAFAQIARKIDNDADQERLGLSLIHIYNQYLLAVMKPRSSLNFDLRNPLSRNPRDMGRPADILLRLHCKLGSKA